MRAFEAVLFTFLLRDIILISECFLYGFDFSTDMGEWVYYVSLKSRPEYLIQQYVGGVDGIWDRSVDFWRGGWFFESRLCLIHYSWVYLRRFSYKNLKMSPALYQKKKEKHWGFVILVLIEPLRSVVGWCGLYCKVIQIYDHESHGRIVILNGW